MSLCAAVASSQSSTFSQDPYNVWNINSWEANKQTKPEKKLTHDKVHLKAQVILKHLDACMSLFFFLLHETVNNPNVPGNSNGRLLWTAMELFQLVSFLPLLLSSTLKDLQLIPGKND